MNTSTPFLRRFVLLVALICLTPVSAAAQGVVRFSGQTMGTYYSVGIYTSVQDLDTDPVEDKLELRLNEINRQMSTWDDESEISKFNASRSTDWQPISKEFATVVKEAQRIFKLTDGAFDPTVEPLIRLWGFGDKRKREVPADDDITAALARCGMQHVSLQDDPPAIKKAIPELQLNLSAIAKGFAVDELYTVLKENGFPECVVDIGGENYAGKAKGGSEPWRLGVESPKEGLRRVMNVSEQAIATSGDYRNFFKVDDVTYSHAIVPTTGRPAVNPPAAVTVVADNCMTADALATAMMVLGAKQGTALANKHQLSVYFQQLEDDDSVTETLSDAFKQIPQKEIGAEPKKAGVNWFPFVATAAVFLLAVMGMAIGTILQNKSLKGSCGGINNLPGSDVKSICDLCTIPKDQCTNTELRAQMQAAANPDEASSAT